MLINPARNPSIFRRRFPIRLWYPSQHLLRQNPLPRSQFGSRRRFPNAASQRQTVVRLACRGQRRRGPGPVVPENSIRADSRDEGESEHHPTRCLPSSICFEHLARTSSSRGAGSFLAPARVAHEECQDQIDKSRNARGRTSSPILQKLLFGTHTGWTRRLVSS